MSSNGPQTTRKIQIHRCIVTFDQLQFNALPTLPACPVLSQSYTSSPSSQPMRDQVYTLSMPPSPPGNLPERDLQIGEECYYKTVPVCAYYPTTKPPSPSCFNPCLMHHASARSRSHLFVPSSQFHRFPPATAETPAPKGPW